MIGSGRTARDGIKDSIKKLLSEVDLSGNLNNTYHISDENLNNTIETNIHFRKSLNLPVNEPHL